MTTPGTTDDGASPAVAELSKRGSGAALKPLLTAAAGGSAVLFAGSIVFAFLTGIQSDYLGSLSEAHGGFDPAVIPPHETLTWIMAMAAPVLTGAVLALVLIARGIVWRAGNLEPSPSDE